MAKNVRYNSALPVILLVTCHLLGCATADFSRGHRFYSGPPLPNKEIALVFAGINCTISDIRVETEQGEKMLGDGPSDMLDLLPGLYIAGIRYSRTSEGFYNPAATNYPRPGSMTIGDRVQLGLDVRAGNIYIIYPEITGTKGRETWRPVIVNINDYRKEECQKFNRWDCVDKDRILELAAKYLKSERRIMTYHQLEKPYVMESRGTRRVINGFWW
mgnify:CR=1 FL=1